MSSSSTSAPCTGVSGSRPWKRGTRSSSSAPSTGPATATARTAGSSAARRARRRRTLGAPARSHSPSTGDKAPRPAETRKFIRGTDALLQVWLGGIAEIDQARVLPFLQSELCALEDLRVVDPHTCHARFVSEAGCRCARHQSQHMLFTPESTLLAFEVLTGQRYRAAARKDPDRSAGAAESARDLYVRWATATPPGEESSRLATLRAYLGSYSQAAHLHGPRRERVAADVGPDEGQP